MQRPTLFRGCRPEVLASPEGFIEAVGPVRAPRDAEVVDLSGETLPGLGDSHLHLGWMARQKLECELRGARSREEALARIRRHAARQPEGAWVIGRGWYNDLWADSSWPGRRELDAATDGRPAIMTRKDGHSAWVNSAALAAAGISRTTSDPPGGVIDRDAAGEPAGIVRETAVELVRRAVPAPDVEAFDRALAGVLRGLVRIGLTQVHTMDGPDLYASLQRLRRRGPLPLRVTWNLPAREFPNAERVGIRSGFGDE